MPFNRSRGSVGPSAGSGSSRTKKAGGREQDTMVLQPAEIDFHFHTTTPEIPSSSRTTPKSEILSITANIAQTLNQFDRMYDESEDSEMLNDISEQLNHMENGPLKFQLKEFVNKYKDVTSQAGEAQEERNDILQSLADWFSEHEFENELSKLSFEEDDTSDSDSVRDGLLNTKMAFDKLKRLNTEIADQSSRGRDVEHLEREKKNLASQAVSQFKSYKSMASENKKEEERQGAMTSSAGEAQAWKHAAGEIVGLLGKIRSEGTEYISELEEKVKEMVKKINDKGNEITRYKNQIREFKAIEKKWQDENMDLTDEKARKSRKIKRLKKELRNMMKQLGKYERVKPSKLLEEEEHGEQEEEERHSPAHKGSHLGKDSETKAMTSKDPAILAAQLKDHKNQLSACKKEKEQLERTIEELRAELEDKDDVVLKLEHDKTELIHQMKQASIRPDNRRLSDVDPLAPTPSTKHMSGSRASVTGVSGVHMATGPEDKKMTCQNCGGTITPSSSTDVQAASPRKNHDKQPNHQPNHQPKPTMAVPQPSVHKNDGRDQSQGVDEELTRLSHQCEQYRAVICKLEQELAVLSARSPAYLNHTPGTQAPHPTPVNTAQGDREQSAAEKAPPMTPLTPVTPLGQGERAGLTPRGEEPVSSLSTHSSTPHPVSPSNSSGVIDSVKVFEEEEASLLIEYASDRPIDPVFDPDDPPHRQIEIHTSPEFAYTRPQSQRSQRTQRHFVNRGMQTDPKLDPLGAWSAAMPENKGWRPPMPPAKWLDFDPTVQVDTSDAGPIPGAGGKRMSIGQAMMSGAEPADIRSEALHCTNLVQRELERMTQGIMGFIEYTNSLVDREAGLMSKANKNLSCHLSQHELERLEKELERPLTSNLAGQKQKQREQDSFSNLLSQMQGEGGRGRRRTRFGDISTKDLEPEFEQLRENMLPVEERVKHQINKIGRDAIDTIKHTHDLVFNALQAQHRQYENIFTTLQKRPQPIQIKTDILEDMEENELGPRKSLSHSSILRIPRKSPALDYDGLAVTGSRSNIHLGKPHSSHHERKQSVYLTPDEFELEHTLSKAFAAGKETRSDAANKLKLDVAKAGLTKRGQILLTTKPMEEVNLNAVFRSQESSRRKVKPAPLSHQMLKKKQTELLVGNRSKDLSSEVVLKGKRRGVTANQVLTDYQLPTDFFGGYTIAELEKRALQYADAQKKAFHESMLDKIHFPDVQTKESLSPRREENDNLPIETFPNIFG